MTYDTKARAREQWRDLCERDDRTSPAEYPNMALITFAEFADALDETRVAGMQDARGIANTVPDGVSPDDWTVGAAIDAITEKIVEAENELVRVRISEQAGPPAEPSP